MSSDLTFSITQKEIDALADEIKKNYTEAQLAQGGAASKFCEVWPPVKEGLTVLKDVLAVVKLPGVALFASAAIAVVLAAGDATSKALCKK